MITNIAAKPIQVKTAITIYHGVNTLSASNLLKTRTVTNGSIKILTIKIDHSIISEGIQPVTAAKIQNTKHKKLTLYRVKTTVIGMNKAINVVNNVKAMITIGII